MYAPPTSLRANFDAWFVVSVLAGAVTVTIALRWFSLWPATGIGVAVGVAVALLNPRYFWRRFGASLIGLGLVQASSPSISAYFQGGDAVGGIAVVSSSVPGVTAMIVGAILVIVTLPRAQGAATGLRGVRAQTAGDQSPAVVVGDVTYGVTEAEVNSLARQIVREETRLRQELREEEGEQAPVDRVVERVERSAREGDKDAASALKAAMESGDLRRIQRALERMADASPDRRTELSADIADVADLRGDFDTAATRRELLLRENPDDVISLCHLGWIRFHQGKFPESITAFRRAVELPGISIARRSFARNGLGNALLLDGDVEGARRAFLAARADAVGGGLVESRIHALGNGAMVEEMLGNPDEAERALREVYNHYRDKRDSVEFVRASANLANFLLRAERSTEAADVAKSALLIEAAIEPDLPAAAVSRVGLALVLVEEDGTSAAAGLLERAGSRVFDAPMQRTNAYLARGRVAEAMGHLDEAVVSYEEATQIEGGSFDAQNHILAYRWLAAARMKLGRNDAAVAAARAAVELARSLGQPDKLGYALATKLVVLRRAERYAELEATAREVVRLGRTEPALSLRTEALPFLAAAYSQRGEFRKAAAAARLAITDCSDMSQAQQAICHSALGRHARERGQFQSAFEQHAAAAECFCSSKDWHAAAWELRSAAAASALAGDAERGLEAADQGLELWAEHTPEDRSLECSLRGRRASCLARLDRYEDTLTETRLARAAAEVANDQRVVAESYGDEASAYVGMGRLEQACRAAQITVDMFKEGAWDDHDTGGYLAMLAVCEAQLGRLDDARAHASEALKIGERLQSHLLVRNGAYALAQVAHASGNRPEAEEWRRRAMDTAREHFPDDLPEVREGLSWGDAPEPGNG